MRGLSERLAAVANEGRWRSPRRVPAGDAPAGRLPGRGPRAGTRDPSAPKDDPTTLEDGVETLGEIARATGFHVRQVTLPHDWADRSGANRCWPSSADEDGRPVALIPARFDRAIRSRGLRPVRSGRRIAAGPSTRVSREQVAPDRLDVLSDAPRSSARAGGPAPLQPAAEWLARPGSSSCWPCSAGLLGLAVPIGVGRPGRPGHPRGRPSRRRDRYARLGHGPAPHPGLFLVGLAVSAAVLQVVEGLVLLRIEGKIVPALVPAVWDRLLRLPTRFFGGFSSGDLALRAMGLSPIFKKVSGAVVTTLVTGLISLVQPGPHVLV